jgi:hypothetical protein
MLENTVAMSYDDVYQVMYSKLDNIKEKIEVNDLMFKSNKRKLEEF